MNCPPTKRFRGLNQDSVTAVGLDDPFGDDDEFTQDDLDEIDVIASQAFTSALSAPASKPVSKPKDQARGSTWPSSPGQNRSATNQSKENKSGAYRGNAAKDGRGKLDNMQQQFGSDREDSYRLLEAQHAELKRKLKEVEEEILLKSGEIRVLRDSLKATQQEKEAQRQNQVLLETQRQKEQSDREKELNKKLQSLQSELQFKEAEIHEMKTKLLSSDKNKTASPLARNSPKVLSTLTQMHQASGSSSSSPIGNGFITKEEFGAEISCRTKPVKTLRDAADGRSSSRAGDGLETSYPDPFLSSGPARRQHKDGVLLGELLLQPSHLCSLGLSHLLSMSAAEFSQLSTGPQLPSDPLDGGSAAGAPRAPLSLVQSLAATGLNMLSQSQTTSTVCNTNNRSCPGAVFLLPLLDLHLSQLCCTLDSRRSSSSSTGIPGSESSTSSSVPAAPAVSPALGRVDEAGVTGFTVEDVGLIALKLLYLLLSRSDEVVKAVLLKTNQTTGKDDHYEANVGLCSQNALLASLLRLCDVRLSGNGAHKEKLALNALQTVCVLVKRTPPSHCDRLQCVFHMVCLCLSQDTRVQTVSECVSVLTHMSNHRTLAKELCSQHDACIFLKLFHLIRTRPDTQATPTDLVLLDLQVVHLLCRVTQRTEVWTNNQQSPCQCYAELVQVVVIIIHRQWLALRGSQEQTSASCWSSPAVSLLRNCLVFLHWLLQHHRSFSESCRPVLHMYDQMIPAVRETLSKIPELSDSEELALEEICRSEGDDTDDMDTDTAS
ncbi:ATR-interacting protein isoform X1 [Fundulus heteroclitus]|uniref:ATR-interacting protein isoform X1 n=1 Tax=Fundulus heteroclitus TaxID=8078 RepID=UPI00165BC191|nr:ATR-interacting protein isoform X1 [Fundulus heteroclitus]XP_036008054.1 ATR-interacting protein isoform X1 [Fundulus heteroclitus]